MQAERFQQIEDIKRQLRVREAREVSRTAVERFGTRLTMATGFGVEGAVLIDLSAREDLTIDVFTLDTGLFFPETYAFWKRLESRYGIAIRSVRPELSVEEQARRFGEALWERDPDSCCRMRKVAPLEAALRGFDAWVTAVRRDQTKDRAGASLVEFDERFQVVKVNPLVAWTADDVWSYVRRHDVPFNPLHDRGYPSIGCRPCTTAVAPGEDPRAGRFRGRAKTECGIHVREDRSS